MNNYFKTRFSFDKKRDIVWAEICRYLQKYISEDSKILDVGAGYGHFINNIRCKEKYAFDVEVGALKHSDSDVKIVEGSSEQVPFQNNVFDVLFISNLLEHLDHQQILNTIAESFRVLKKSGIIIILSPNFKYCPKVYFDDYTHKTIITDVGAVDLLESSGFNVIKSCPKFLPFSVKQRLPISSFLVKVYIYSSWKPFGAQFLIIGKKQ